MLLLNYQPAKNIKFRFGDKSALHVFSGNQVADFIGDDVEQIIRVC